MDWIQGEKFMSLADNKKIFYCHTHDVSNIYSHIPPYPYILITHNSDHKVDVEPPKNCIYWFTQNVNITDDRIESLPIGLENEKWFRNIGKKTKMYNLLQQSKTFKNLVYMNHNILTNPEKRTKPYQVLNNKSWVTIENGVNGHGFDEYIHDVYNHQFVICPEGNGIDTHRTWETFYMNSIPIEKRNINNQFYTDLPICFVDDWEEVTEEFLNSEYHRIKSSTWNIAKLTFTYWKEKILLNKWTGI